MVDTAIIAPEQKTAALRNTDRRLRYMTSKLEGGKYFADWVYAEVNAYIGERENDINVYTTLDKEIQKAAGPPCAKRILPTRKPRTLPTARSWFWIKRRRQKQMAGGVNEKKPV